MSKGVLSRYEHKKVTCKSVGTYLPRLWLSIYICQLGKVSLHVLYDLRQRSSPAWAAPYGEFDEDVMGSGNPTVFSLRDNGKVERRSGIDRKIFLNLISKKYFCFWIVRMSNLLSRITWRTMKCEYRFTNRNERASLPHERVCRLFFGADLRTTTTMCMALN